MVRVDTELLQQRWLVLEALSLEAWPMFEAAEVRGRLRDEHLAHALADVAPARDSGAVTLATWGSEGEGGGGSEVQLCFELSNSSFVTKICIIFQLFSESEVRIMEIVGESSVEI